MRSRVLVAGLTLAALLLAACAGRGQQAARPVQEAGPEEIVVALGADARTLLPMTIVDWTTNAQLRNIFDTLFSRDPQTMKIIPALATGYKILDDLTWEITLRQGVRFHNGEPFNAKSVKFTMDYILNPDNQSHYLPQYKLVREVQIVDDYTVRIHTAEPFPSLLDRLVDFMPLPPEYVTQVGVEEASRKPVGTGAYKFVEWERDVQLKLEKNPDYWQGEPEFDRVTFRYIPDFSARLAALLAGEIHIMKDVPPQAVEQVNSSGKATVRVTESSRINYIALVNLKPGPMQDVRVRKALNYAVNVDQLIQTVLQGRATRICGALNPFNSGYNPDVPCYQYDPDKAVALLREAGYEPQQLRFVLDSPSGRYPQDDKVAQAIAAQLGQLGIQVQVVINEWGTHLSKIKNRQTGEMFLLGWGPSLEPQGTIEPLFQRDWTYSGFGDPELEAMIQRAVRIVEPQARKAAFDEIQLKIHDLAPWIFLWQQHDLYGVANFIDWQPRPDERLWMFEAKRSK